MSLLVAFITFARGELPTSISKKYYYRIEIVNKRILGGAISLLTCKTILISERILFSLSGFILTIILFL